MSWAWIAEEGVPQGGCRASWELGLVLEGGRTSPSMRASGGCRGFQGGPGPRTLAPARALCPTRTLARGPHPRLLAQGAHEQV